MTHCCLLYCLNGPILRTAVEASEEEKKKKSFMVPGDDSAGVLAEVRLSCDAVSGCGGKIAFVVGGSALQLFTPFLIYYLSLL